MIPVVPVVPVAVVPDTITYTLTTPAINNYTIAYVDSNGSVQKVNFSGTNWTKVITRGKYVLGVEFYAFEPVPFVNSVATISIQVNGIVKKTLTYKFNTNNAIEAILSYEF